MRYHTKNELEHFGYRDAVLASIRLHPGSLYLEMDNVTIHPDNSCNRDVRPMRANGLCLRLQAGEILSFVREAYRVYDADGNLTTTQEDQEIAPDLYADAFRELENATMYEITREDGIYRIELDVEEYTYRMDVRASGDEEEWDRFLNIES